MPTPEALKRAAAHFFPGELPAYETPAEATEPAVRAPDPSVPCWIFDTNVVLDIVYWRNPAAMPLAAAVADGTVRAAIDLDAALELAEVLSRSTFGLSEAEAAARWQAWLARCECLPKARILAAAKTCEVQCRDPLDQKFLILALAADAAVIVTHDKLVLKAGRRLCRRHGIRAITPAAAVTELDAMRVAAH